MLHKGKVAIAVWGNAKRQVRISLGMKARIRHWPPNGVEAALQHHTQLVQRFLKEKPDHWQVGGKTICEVGSKDCLAIASLLIGLGAKHVEMIEPFPPPCLTKDQVRILQTIQKNGLELDPSILRDGAEPALDTSKVSFRTCFMEEIPDRDLYDYMYSIHVLEHVEDLPGFYRACHNVLKPGGQMFHIIDFSGHGELEDPVPPLDHQTYADWIHDLMYPPYYRQTRFFLSDHRRAILNAGLAIDEIRMTRLAGADYVNEVWPKLRKEAQAIPKDELAVLEAVVVSRKPKT
jgi:SAM-dependent methyltransferase